MVYNLLTNNSEKNLCALCVCVVKEEGWGGGEGRRKHEQKWKKQIGKKVSTTGQSG